jgi:hypothetical protein
MGSPADSDSGYRLACAASGSGTRLSWVLASVLFRAGLRRRWAYDRLRPGKKPLGPREAAAVRGQNRHGATPYSADVVSRAPAAGPLQGYALADSAQALGLDELSATAALARARNHVRGRLDDYPNAARSTT